KRGRPMPTAEKIQTRERFDLLQTLDKHRNFLRFTTRDLGDDDARRRTTVSSLTLGGLIKHVAATEFAWMNFVLDGAPGMARNVGDYENGFTMLGSETLDGLLERYAEVALQTTNIVNSLADLDADHPLPEAPWFEKGASWS